MCDSPVFLGIGRVGGVFFGENLVRKDIAI